jgi:hypothetical protein
MSKQVKWLLVVVVAPTGKISPWTGRFYSLLDPSYAKNHIPIIASVSEHQPTSWSSFYFDLQILVFLFPAGLYFCFSKLSDANIFLVLYGVTSIYFAVSIQFTAERGHLYTASNSAVGSYPSQTPPPPIIGNWRAENLHKSGKSHEAATCRVWHQNRNCSLKMCFEIEFFCFVMTHCYPALLSVMVLTKHSRTGNPRCRNRCVNLLLTEDWSDINTRILYMYIIFAESIIFTVKKRNVYTTLNS